MENEMKFFRASGEIFCLPDSSSIKDWWKIELPNKILNKMIN